MEEPAWKKLKLSLERPYKDDTGEYIPVLLDITPDGQHIYEPREDPSQALGEKLRRIFLERGVDFFDTYGTAKHVEKDEKVREAEEAEVEHDVDDTHRAQPMTAEELYKMRMELMPQLYIALGEMSHARDLLGLLLSSTSTAPPAPEVRPLLPSHAPSPAPPLPHAELTATVITKPPPIPSVQTFNAQLTIGGKDEALRQAADVFKSAAAGMERTRVRGEQYWAQALKIRKANWGLVPAPLPFGSATGKGADKTSKDFLISFGLEDSSPAFRRRAISHMPTFETSSNLLEFPHRQKTRLRVRLTTVDDTGKQITSQNVLKLLSEDTVDSALGAAQREIIEQEIFSLLIRESSALPTASSRVAERLIVIEASQDTELCFELVNSDSVGDHERPFDNQDGKCDLIFAVLHILLLRVHTYFKSQRLRSDPSPTFSQPPHILQPIIDALQYEVFCRRVKAEIMKIIHALKQAGVPSSVRLNSVGESGHALVDLLSDQQGGRVNGEVVVRIGNRDTLRFTLTSPSLLYVHLPQGTIFIASITQLGQLLTDEVELRLLNRICEVGTELCSPVNGTWFVDLITSRAVGRWEGCVL
ncbi:hypothetical protein GLOTRDRAFT_70848 [Gloeophyllum trabeum ATCC 11539]|uniref:Mediator of RNA polymerase II transcription subunit 17 n=1 Tax=Gloeophyllum trabeum (strain ATCC 11539 / FP-39264 / Madison 617) TaxID=670483 RepID=S7RX07_GLOTA|nr:uncharacterized protein GLOTRDRAFT_70848 [Gloeophyllum trabeum ATCC 11539]EPQ59420.1 hypothetical protein GLOTRDRAFT_70848 [Gloeophyllum trabeum ATCC 11539]